MNNFSDSNWGISYPNRGILKQEFMEATNNDTDTIIMIELFN